MTKKSHNEALNNAHTKSPKIIYIHRGRNKKSTEIGKLFTNVDYNFDYRGRSKLILFIKSLLTSTEIPKADIYFVEGGLCLNVAYFVKKFKAKNSKIILQVPEPFFNLEHASKITKWWTKKIVKSVNGMFVISDMVKEDARKVYAGPIEKGHHYAVDIERFLNIKPNLRSHKIVFVGERPLEAGKVKGLDIAIETFKILKEKFIDAELLLVGSGTDELDYGIDGIKYLGFRKMEEIFTQVSIVISPGRYDAFPIAIVEASCSGVVPVISNHVGSKEFVVKADKKLVVNSLDPNEYAKVIESIWKMDSKDLNKLSQKLREIGSYYNQENCLEEFRVGWKKLLKI